MPTALTPQEVEDLLKEFQENEPTWDELLSETGKNIEDIGRMLRGKGRKKPKVWTIEDFECFRTCLLSYRRILKYHIEHLKEDDDG